MATQQSSAKGVTPPISTALPTPQELASNDALIEELKRQNNFESLEETERRKKALTTLQRVTIEFVKESMQKKARYSPAVLNAAGGKIFTYGSYRLGVYGPGSDIDTLVVAPKEVTLDDFFANFPSILERMSPPGAITELTPVPDAYVPIIKLEWCGISIDLIFASLAVSSVPLNLDLKDDKLLRGLDDRAMRCVNGTRVTDMILELVPQQKVFRTALRAVKLWAQRRAIYANIMAFPGGVAWAMLVARTCQLYPQATGSVIVGKFFRIMSNWKWPQPVLLKNIEPGIIDARVWNPKIYPADRFHLMPIITPAFPAMCATHNINLSTKAVILRELTRAGDITDKIFVGQLQWKDLFERHTFFTQGYKYYLEVVACSRTAQAQLLWSGLVESKVRFLVSDLDSNDLVKIAHPFNKGFERVHRCKNQEEIDEVIHGSLKYQAKDIKTEEIQATANPLSNAVAEAADKASTLTDQAEDTNGTTQDQNVPNAINGLEYAIGNGLKQETDEQATSEGVITTLYTTTYYIGLELNQQAKVKLDISYSTTQLKDRCTSWQSYDPDTNSIHVVHSRSWDLPDDVFIEGEVKPVKPKKKTAKKEITPKQADGGVKKRKLEQNGIDEPMPDENDAKRRQSANGIPIKAA